MRDHGGAGLSVGSCSGCCRRSTNSAAVAGVNRDDLRWCMKTRRSEEVMDSSDGKQLDRSKMEENRRHRDQACHLCQQVAVVD